MRTSSVFGYISSAVRRVAQIGEKQGTGGVDKSVHSTEFAALDVNRPLAMMHVPKSAGTSVSTWIEQTLNPAVSVRGFDRAHFAPFHDFSSVDPQILALIHLDIKLMPEDADLVMGHFSRSTLVARYPEAQLITFLRAPVSRLLSLWVYWRCVSDDTLARWGALKERVLLSHGSLKDFLKNPLIASQTDNVVTRMLLEPHALINCADFIGGADDGSLISEAIGCLKRFSYLDVIENPSFTEELGKWLHSESEPTRLNETERVPASLRVQLERELDDETLALLDERCRLDDKLWTWLARERMPGTNVDEVLTRAICRSIARCSALLAP